MCCKWFLMQIPKPDCQCQADTVTIYSFLASSPWMVVSITDFFRPCLIGKSILKQSCCQCELSTWHITFHLSSTPCNKCTIIDKPNYGYYKMSIILVRTSHTQFLPTSGYKWPRAPRHSILPLLDVAHLSLANKGRIFTDIAFLVMVKLSYLPQQCLRPARQPSRKSKSAIVNRTRLRTPSANDEQLLSIYLITEARELSERLQIKVPVTV